MLLRHLSREQRLALGRNEAALALARHRPVQDEVHGVLFSRRLPLGVLALLFHERLKLWVISDSLYVTVDFQD